MNVNITVNGLPELRSSLRDFSDRRFNAAIATALTRTAVAVRAAASAELIDYVTAWAVDRGVEV